MPIPALKGGASLVAAVALAGGGCRDGAQADRPILAAIVALIVTGVTWLLTSLTPT